MSKHVALYIQTLYLYRCCVIETACPLQYTWTVTIKFPDSGNITTLGPPPLLNPRKSVPTGVHRPVSISVTLVSWFWPATPAIRLEFRPVSLLLDHNHNPNLRLPAMSLERIFMPSSVWPLRSLRPDGEQNLARNRLMFKSSVKMLQQYRMIGLEC